MIVSAAYSQSDTICLHRDKAFALYNASIEAAECDSLMKWKELEVEALENKATDAVYAAEKYKHSGQIMAQQAMECNEQLKNAENSLKRQKIANKIVLTTLFVSNLVIYVVSNK